MRQVVLFGTGLASCLAIQAQTPRLMTLSPVPLTQVPSIARMTQDLKLTTTARPTAVILPPTVARFRMAVFTRTGTAPATRDEAEAANCLSLFDTYKRQPDTGYFRVTYLGRVYHCDAGVSKTRVLGKMNLASMKRIAPPQGGRATPPLLA